MGKVYELADGSLSADYEIGDAFVVNSRIDEQSAFSEGSIIRFYRDDNSGHPLFKLIEGDCCFNNCLGNKSAFVWWFCLTPTLETKRKAQARKRKFTINAGDYIDSREFNREECERFCELAVECGFGRGEWLNWYRDAHLPYVGLYLNSLYWSCVPLGEWDDVTQQFREFLNKEKGMFTKADLKDGVTAIHRNGLESVFLRGDFLADRNKGNWSPRCNAREFDYDLTHFNERDFDVIRVTDRDGTALFEREEETRELTIEEIAKAFNLPVERVRIKK